MWLLCSLFCGWKGVTVQQYATAWQHVTLIILDFECVLTCCCVVAMFLVLWLKGCYCATVCNCMATCNTYNIRFWVCSNILLCGCYGVWVVPRVLLCKLFKNTFKTKQKNNNLDNTLDIKVLTCCCVVAMFLVLWLLGCYSETCFKKHIKNTLGFEFVANMLTYHPAAQDWSPTEAKQGWAWSVPGWETSWEN